MATGLLKCYNMVWEVKTKDMPNAVQKVQLMMDQRSTVMNESLEMLKCNEHLPSSPGYDSSDDHMELDDLPELQAVQTDSTSPEVFHIDADVSHQQYTVPSWNQKTSNMSESAYSCDSGVNWLTELANIATSPQSPLMQCSFYNRSSPVHIIATSKSLHSYARPPPASSESETSPSKSHWKEESAVRRQRANSESESGIFCMSSFSDDDDLGWCHSWPVTVWHCFLQGTRLCFHKGRKKQWQTVDDFTKNARYRNERENAVGTYKGYGADGLKLISHEESVSYGESVLQLTFDPGTTDGLLTVECRLDHPFYIKNKGWSSFYPSLTVVQHGIPCCEMHVGDICLPPGHPDAMNFDDSGVFDTFKSYDFTPMDSSAVYVLSSMARQRRASLSNGGASSPDSERAISVILGDRWKKMKNEERRMYTIEAKALAEEQKRLNPDCWKRKRTNSGSQQH
ncbi:HMG box-containing protein 1 isoform X2 [Spea bombifrons]|uniref:HMG box-containing protein 1 isoform X2 n=1 Tax=Spea bombifrons TaxID=233779 RepID=UPI00234B9F93|nr:HMG box-containing protein 1 isoform X2 [Spea bombifrons]